MKKAEALKLFGDSVASAAAEIGVSTSAISQWPDDLPPRLVDRVHAALWRRAQRESTGGASLQQNHSPAAAAARS